MKRISKHLNPGSTKFNKIDASSVTITSNNLVDVILSIEDKDLTSSFIMNLFGKYKGKRLCNPYDTITIPTGLYGAGHKKPNKKPFITTVGLWIFNKHFIEEELFDELHYVNYEIGKKAYSKLNTKLSYALAEDRITVTQFSHFLEKVEEYMKFETVLASNYSEQLLCCSKEINKLKKKLIAQNKKAIEDADPIAAEKIEQELIAYGRKILGDDPALDIYLSGATGNFNNHFKNLFAFRGVIRNPDPYAKKDYNIITSSYMDGVKPEEYADLANSLAAGPYARGKKTATGGYWETLFISGLQHLILDKEGSDCGTTRTITVTLTDDNIERWMYNWIKEGSKLVELTSQNMDKYIGKTVKFRFASLCESKNCICSKCAGNLWYRLGIKNLGVMLAQIPAKLKLISMKAFHDSTVTTIEMDPMKAFNIKK